MRALIYWFENDDDTHPLVKCALFSYEFVSIHPFQDGNGRLSRLISTLLLRKYGYQWIRYVSLEHEIESQKTEYYRVLRASQVQRPGENITPWITFFLNCLKNIHESLMKKLETRGVQQAISQREKLLLNIIEGNPRIKTSERAKKLAVSSATVKRMLENLLTGNLIERQGTGPGSYYTLL
jgi:Fic family protein